MRLAPLRPASRRGQGQSEYILTVFLIAIACILAVGYFGDNVRALFGASTESLDGKANVKVNTTPGGKRDEAPSRDALNP